MIKNYDPNIRWGTHTIEVTLQVWEYTGTFQYRVGGNMRGAHLMEDAEDTLTYTPIHKNDCKLKIIDEEYFHCVLKDKDGNELFTDGELYEMSNIIVGIRFVEFEEDAE